MEVRSDERKNENIGFADLDAVLPEIRIRVQAGLL